MKSLQYNTFLARKWTILIAHVPPFWSIQTDDHATHITSNLQFNMQIPGWPWWQVGSSNSPIPRCFWKLAYTVTSVILVGSYANLCLWNLESVFSRI